MTCPSCDEEVDQLCARCKSCDACCECEDGGEFDEEEDDGE